MVNMRLIAWNSSKRVVSLSLKKGLIRGHIGENSARNSQPYLVVYQVGGALGFR